MRLNKGALFSSNYCTSISRQKNSGCLISSMGPQTHYKVSHVTLFNTHCRLWDLKLSNFLN
ncbi:hypothetical protein GHT06_018952 [Daphnia sinensis]|uniref:Uncharacterized protein n=1 Tax=Daphnia sinensis TaxID=1820382 RepID=A0AAD5PSS5_9CRUS|nr:hypothetical protein GHT06_018952 [Daphnia sinensis]